MFDEAGLVVLDFAIRKWVAKKYGLIGIDDEGLGVYRVHPDDWEVFETSSGDRVSDLEMVESWESFKLSGPKRTNDALKAWYDIAEARGVDLTATRHFTQKEKKQRRAIAIAGGVAGAAILWYLAKPSGASQTPIDSPDDVQRKLAGIFDGVFSRRPRPGAPATEEG